MMRAYLLFFALLATGESLYYAADIPQCEDGTFLAGIYYRGDDNYSYALRVAAGTGNAVIVQCLIDNGAEISEKSRDGGETALHTAAQEGHVDVAEVLLKNGADVDVEQ